jgi:hypothetical protein
VQLGPQGLLTVARELAELVGHLHLVQVSYLHVLITALPTSACKTNRLLHSTCMMV